MPNLVCDPAFERSLATVASERAIGKEPIIEDYARIICAFSAYESSLISTLENSFAAGSEDQALLRSFKDSPIKLDSLFELKSQNKINHTQFLLLTHLSFIQNLRSELQLIKDKGFSSVETLFKSLEIFTQLKQYTAIYEDIAICDPAAFHSFKLINHYALTPFTKEMYDLVKDKSQMWQIIKNIISGVMLQMLPSQKKDANYGELDLLLRDLAASIGNDVVYGDQDSSLATAPAQRAIVGQLREAAIARGAAPHQISSLITEAVLPGKLGLNFNKANIQKLKTHIVRLIELESKPGVAINAALFRTYIELCFPEGTDYCLIKRNNALGKIDKFINSTRIFNDQHQQLACNVRTLQENISHVAELIGAHRKSQNITNFSSLTLQSLHDRIQQEVVAMQSTETNNGTVINMLATVQQNLGQISAAENSAIAMKTAISMIRQLTGQVGTPNGGTQAAILKCLSTIEENIDGLLSTDNTVKNTAKAAVLAGIAIIVAENKYNTRVVDYIRRLEDSIEQIHKASSNEDRIEIIGEFVSVNLFFAMGDLTSFALRTALDGVTYPFRAIANRLFTASAPEEEPVSSVSPPPVVEVQSTSDQLELLTRVLKEQQGKLTKLIRNINYQTSALLMTQSGLSSVVRTGDGISIFTSQLMAFDTNAPMPYQLPDQLKQLNDYDKMLAKLYPIKNLVDAKLGGFTESPDSTVSKALKNAYDKFNENYQAIIKKRDELYSNVCAITLAELKTAIGIENFNKSFSAYQELEDDAKITSLLKLVKEMGLARDPAVRAAVVKLVKIQDVTSGDGQKVAKAILKTPEQRNFSKYKPSLFFAILGFIKNCIKKIYVFTSGMVGFIFSAIISRARSFSSYFKNKADTDSEVCLPVEVNHDVPVDLSDTSSPISPDSLTSLDTDTLGSPTASEISEVDNIKKAADVSLTCKDFESHEDFKSKLSYDVRSFLDANSKVVLEKLDLLSAELQAYKLTLESSQDDSCHQEKLQKLDLLESNIRALHTKVQLIDIDGSVQSRLCSVSDLEKISSFDKELAAIKAQVAVKPITVSAVARASMGHAVSTTCRTVFGFLWAAAPSAEFVNNTQSSPDADHGQPSSRSRIPGLDAGL